MRMLRTFLAKIMDGKAKQTPIEEVERSFDCDIQVELSYLDNRSCRLRIKVVDYEGQLIHEPEFGTIAIGDTLTLKGFFFKVRGKFEY